MKRIIICIVLLQQPLIANACYSLEKETIEIVGNVKKVTYPGSPNYESIKDGDAPEIFWVLESKKEICFKGYEKKQTKFQLYWLDGKKHIINAGKYKITGKTMEAHTAHHRTPVLIEVIKASKP